MVGSAWPADVAPSTLAASCVLSQDLFKQTCKWIMSLPNPDKDPVSGEAMHHWLDAPSSTEGWNEWRYSLDWTS